MFDKKSDKGEGSQNPLVEDSFGDASLAYNKLKETFIQSNLTAEKSSQICEDLQKYISSLYQGP